MAESSIDEPSQTVIEKDKYSDDACSVNSYEVEGLKRALEPRHLTFISIGACIGTGTQRYVRRDCTLNADNLTSPR